MTCSQPHTGLRWKDIDEHRTINNRISKTLVVGFAAGEALYHQASSPFQSLTRDWWARDTLI